MRTNIFRLVTCQLAFIATLGGCSKNTDSPAGKTVQIREINQKEITSPKAVIAISGATIIDGTGRDPIENGCVIVTDGVISAAGRRADIEIPENAQVIDARGLTLLPGFIDSHFHLDGIHGLPAQFLQNGVTSLRDPGAWIEAYDAERKTGEPIPRLFLAGPHIDLFPPA